MKIISSIFLTLFTLSACDSDNQRAPLACGGGIDFVCPISMYCQMAEDCGGIDSSGYCAPVPKSCPDEENLICGCDNKEYKNKCIANTQGISLKNVGPCIRSPEIEVNQ